jgi:AcrR family transcriptional regulator
MTGTVPLDRRQRRRLESIEQVLDVAVEVMADQGVAGLTLGEVARRMGIRPPSLYVYFDSKNALYDALFERGWRELLAVLLEARNRMPVQSPEDGFRAACEVFVRWGVEHPAYAPLMFWRPVPGFTPSERAYGPAIEIERMSRNFLAEMKRSGGLRADVDLDLAFRTWTTATSGVLTQQLANAPGEPFDTGTFTSALSDVVAMWLAHYGGRRDSMSD